MTGDSIDEVRAVLGECWRGSGLVVRHLDELVERVADGVEDTTRWQWSERFGWFTDSRHSLRNPDSPEGLRVLSDAGLRSLTALKSCFRLDLRGIAVTEEGIASLQRMVPAMKINH